MAFHRQRLLDESAPDPYAAQLCGPYCHATVNPRVICPLTCIVLCPDTCKTHFLQIPSPPPPPVDVLDGAPEKQFRVPLLLTISVAILATAFFFSTCYAVFRLCSNRYSSRRSWWPRRQAEEDDDFLDEEHGPVVDHPTWYIRTVGLQPLVISAITVVRYKRGDGLIEDTDCSVCLNEFEEDETLRLLPKCNHAFHIPCIDTWLRSHTNCPVCRAEIVNNTEPLELIVQSPENRVGGVSGSSGEVRREPENESSELRFGVEDHGESRAHQVGLKMDENLGEEDKSDGVKPMRRSLSVESSIANAFPGQWVEEKRRTSGVTAPKVGANQSFLRLVGSPSSERCRQSGTSSIKRSLSCGAKVFPSRHSSKSPNSVIPQ